MENETLTVDSDTQELVALHELFAQACERMMSALDRFIEAVKDGSELPPREEWPDLLLEPDLKKAHPVRRDTLVAEVSRQYRLKERGKYQRLTRYLHLKLPLP